MVTFRDLFFMPTAKALLQMVKPRNDHEVVDDGKDGSSTKTKAAEGNVMGQASRPKLRAFPTNGIDKKSRSNKQLYTKSSGKTKRSAKKTSYVSWKSCCGTTVVFKSTKKCSNGSGKKKTTVIFFAHNWIWSLNIARKISLRGVWKKLENHLCFRKC